jgi:hypothetical protein
MSKSVGLAHRMNVPRRAVARVTLAQPCKATVQQINSDNVYRATITREGKPDLDAFGPTPFEALYAAVLQEFEELKK